MLRHSPQRPAVATARLSLYAAWVGYGGLLISGLGLWVLLIVQSHSFASYTASADFAGSYIGATLVRHGDLAQLYDVAAQEAVHQAQIEPYGFYLLPIFNYPAWNALALTPLAAYPYPLAFALWRGVNSLLGGLAVLLLLRAVAPSRRTGVVLVLAVTAFWPFLLTLMEGQMGMVVLLGLAGAAVSLRAGHEAHAGLWLLLGLVKPQLIVVPLLALLLLHAWRALIVYAVGTGVVLALSLVALGNWLTPYLALLTDFVRPEKALGDLPTLMDNWRGIVYRLLGSDTSASAGILIAVLTVGSLAFVVALCRPRPAGQPRDLALPFAVSSAVGLLVNPHCYFYDAVILLVPGVLLWQAALGNDLRLRLLRGVLAVGPVVALAAPFLTLPLIKLGGWYLVLVLLAIGWAWPALVAARSGVYASIGNTAYEPAQSRR